MNGELLHFGPITVRAVGTGTLVGYLRSLDDARSSQIPSITLSMTGGKETQVLAGFVEQRARLEFRTEAINETFNISKIVIFVKPIFSEYPK